MNEIERQYLTWLINQAERGNKEAKLALLRKAMPDHIKRGVGSKALATFCVANPELEEEAWQIFSNTESELT